MHGQSTTCGVLRPLPSCSYRRCALTTSQIVHPGIHLSIFHHIPPTNKQIVHHRPFSPVGAASDQRGMAETVLSKPHRFILVSDLDWTMVRIITLVSLTCTQSQMRNVRSSKHPSNRKKERFLSCRIFHTAGGPQ